MKLLSQNKFKNTLKDTFLEGLLPRLKEQRIQAFLTLATTLISVSIFSFFAINPTLTTIATLKKHLADSQFVDQKLVEKIANVSSLQQNYIQLQDSLPSIMDAIPINPDISIFVAQIQAIGQITHVNVSKIDTLPVELTPTAPLTGYLSFTFSIEAQGTSTNISNFISTLQSYNRIITVDDISISSIHDVSTLQLSIKGKSYFKKA